MPEYYKWNQWFFLKFYEKGLVYRKKSAVNWCPKCNTVLANEQVHSGKCWRHEDTDVEIKQLEQWFIKTTNYADELLEDIKKLHWPNRIKLMQENWIGKSYGTDIRFEINGEDWIIFTTRPDTIYGITFMVIAAQHPRLMEIVTEEQKDEVEDFLKKIRSTSVKATAEELELLEKEGVFTGSYAIHPLTNEKIPVYAGNFVIADYGGGMVMAVPAHDQRDFEFAKKYNIPIKVVINPPDWDLNPEKMTRAYIEEGVLVNSGIFDGYSSTEAIDEITKSLEEKKLGKKTVQYKLKDWLISRQRYWGTPIPMVYCDKCGIVSIPENELPVKLPDKVKFGEGNPLSTNSRFVNTKCPKCKGKARRETDTMDTFFDSSWYFLRYCDNKNNAKPFEHHNAKYWMPVDQYIGGAEHACMHLIYARFFTKALRDLGIFQLDEPFTRLFNQGMLHGSDGNKMSKSLGNVINPIEMIEKYSADALRFNLMSLAAPDKDSIWSDRGMESSFKFLSKAYYFIKKIKTGKSSKKIESKLNKTIKEYTHYIENFKYNLAIIKLRALFEDFEKEKELSKETVMDFLKMLSLFCPYMAEELWNKGNGEGFISATSWPKYDESKIDLRAEEEEKIVENTITDINSVLELMKLEKPNEIVLFVADEWKYKFVGDLKSEMEKTRNVGELIKKVMIKEHGKDISALVPKLVKDPSKIPHVVLDQHTEIEALKKGIDLFEKEFGTNRIAVFKAEESKEAKAKQAMPGKPAILIV